jgi:replicative DNA helicase
VWGLEMLKNNFYNWEYEKAILGSILQKPLILDQECAQKSFMGGFFHDLKNRLIFIKITELSQNHIEPNIVTVTQKLIESNDIEKAGGASYVSMLPDFANVSNINFYLDEVKKLFQKRELYTYLDNTKKALADVPDVQNVIDNLNDNLTGLQLIDNPRSTEDTLKDSLERFRKDCEKKRNSKSEFTGLPTGITHYDKITSGMQEEEFIIIAARPSLGKTALAISMINNMLNRGISVGFFSLEMSEIQIISRFLSIRTHTELYKIRNGLKNDIDFNTVFRPETVENFCALPLKLCDETNINIKTLRAKARYFKKALDIQCIFIDYIGLIDSGMEGRPVYEQQSYVSKELKKMAKELKIPVVALCQVSRSVEDKVPTIADLRGSGSIEQDADQVILLHGDRFEDKEIQERDFILAKNRNGAVFQDKIKFNKKFTEYFV